MTTETVDQNSAQLEQEAQQTSQLIKALAGKLQTASTNGDATTRERLLDLKEPQYAPSPMVGGMGGGGMLRRFLGGGMGRAIMNGAGFGIDDDLINKIF